MLVVFPATRLGLAHGALLVGAGAGVSLRVGDGVVASLVARGT